MVSSELSTIRTSIDQVASKVTLGQDEIQTSLRMSHDHLRSEVSQTGRKSSRGLKAIRNEVQYVNLLANRAQRQSRQHQRRLYSGISHLESMLSQLSSVRLESQGRGLKSALAQHSRLDSIMLSLMLIRSSLHCAVSQRNSVITAKIPEEAVKFLLDEFEQLVAFGHEASAMRTRQSLDKFDGDERPTSTLCDYSLNVDSFSTTSVTPRRQWRTLSHLSTVGRLELRFEERIGDCNGMPTAMLNAPFHFAPNRDVHSTGVFASFKKEMQMARKPFIGRTLREIRHIPGLNQDDSAKPIITALSNDDVPSVQRMLSLGQVRPWDEDWGGRNFLEVW